MFNPVIIIALVVQSFISKANRMAGAIAGFAITLGILVWGLSAYSEGDAIAFFGIVLSQEIFLLACLVWFGFDTKELVAALRSASAAKEALDSLLLKDSRNIGFYQRTQKAWAEGKLDNLNKDFAKEGKGSYDDFVKTYLPYDGGSLHLFFTKYPPKENEYLIGYGDTESGDDRSWFVLTNLRLIQKDGRDNSYKEIILDEVDSYEFSGSWTKILKFNMKSGHVVDFEKVEIFPTESFLEFVVKEKQAA